MVWNTQTSLVIIVHLWFIWCVWWERLHDTIVSDNDYFELRNRDKFPSCECVGKHVTVFETDNFEKDPETKDLQLVEEPGVGRNHGQAMGKS